MTALYPGYEFLHDKKVWTCQTSNTLGYNYEPMWMCRSDAGDIRNFGLSQIAAYPQVLSAADAPQAPIRDGVHGNRGRYTKGCRCEACRTANAEYQKAYRLRRG